MSCRLNIIPSSSHKSNMGVSDHWVTFFQAVSQGCKFLPSGSVTSALASKFVPSSSSSQQQKKDHVPTFHCLGLRWTHLTASKPGECSPVLCPGRREKEEIKSQFQPHVQQVLDRLAFPQSFPVNTD